MKKILIFSIILFVILFFCNTLVNGADISMDLEADQTQSAPEQTQEQTGTESTADETQADDPTVYGSDTQDQTADTVTDIDAPITVGTSAALSSSDLALSNILNIILIVLGILLVLLAIAILIRLH